jgi:hypothetical protein
VNSANVANMNTFSLKIDHQLSSKNLVNGRFFYGRSYQSAPAFVGQLTPANGPQDMFNSVTDPTAIALVGLVWNSTVSDRSFLTVRFGYNRMSQTIDVNNKVDPASLGINTGPLDAADFGVPAVYLGAFGYIGGVGGYPITTSPTETYDVSTSLTQTRGQHTLKVGGNWQFGKNHSVRNRARTIFTVSGGGSFENVDSLVGLLLGRFDDASRSFGSTDRDMTQSSVGAYINDDWKISARLTVSAGLRYDFNTPITEVNNLASNFFPDRGLVKLGSGLDRLYDPDGNNFGPRAGIAWDVTGDGKTSVRSGYALTYDLPDFKTVHSPNTTWTGLAARAGAMTNPDLNTYSVTLSGTQNALPDSRTATCINPNAAVPSGDFVCVQPGVAIFGSSPTGAPPFNAFSVPTDYRTPMYHYFHGTLQREIFRGNAVTVTYLGSRGRGQSWFKDINGPALGSPFDSPQEFRPFTTQYPTLGHIIQLTNDGKSWYDALQLSYRQQGWRGLNTQYNYTLSSCEDLNSDNSRGRNNFPQANNPYDPAANRGPCDFDRRHNFNISGAYSFPGTGALAGGWQVATIFTALSGRPFTANVSSRDQSGQDTGSLRADCMADPVYDFTNPDAFITNLAQAFGTPAAGRLGSCGRNSVRSPGLAQWDVNVIKEFHITGGTRVQARWEIFNLLNRVNLGFPANTSSNVRSGLFGTIQSTPDVEAGNPVIAQGGPRAMQWAVKILF